MTQAAGAIKVLKTLVPDGTSARLLVKSAEMKTSQAGNEMLVAELKHGDETSAEIPSDIALTNRTVLNGTPEQNAVKLRRVICSAAGISASALRRGEVVPPLSPNELKANPGWLVGKYLDVTLKVEVDANGIYDDKNAVKFVNVPN